MQYGTQAYGHRAPPPVRYLDAVTRQLLAPWWKRLVAILIDGIITAIPFLVVVLVFGAIASAIAPTLTATTGHDFISSSGKVVLCQQGPCPIPGTTSHTVTSVILLVFGYLLSSVGVGVYFAAMNGGVKGQTVGKMSMGIGVRDSSTAGPVGFGRALGRWAILIPFTLLLSVPYIVDNLAPLWDQRRQSWHDKVARTIVVELR
jgi:uncharacterized RDD family membrane protein YckC